MERLAEEGCDDALVGVGKPDRLALDFVREAALQMTQLSAQLKTYAEPGQTQVDRGTSRP